MVSVIKVGQYIQENCYIFSDEYSHCFIVDPGAQPDLIKKIIRKNSLTVDSILITHAHFDHIGAVKDLSSDFNIPVYIHKTEEDYLHNSFYNLSCQFGNIICIDNSVQIIDIKDGSVINFKSPSQLSLYVMKTPGHTPDSVVFYCKKKNFIFTGDTIFRGSYGRYDFPGGDFEILMKSIERILLLPDKTVLFPGHGEKTTIGEEKKLYKK